jgi:transcriptional regulator with XRE-family HTH domain
MTENSIDSQIGRKLRQLRNMKGISQTALAQESGITFQQVQKYEKGVNRISSARLYDFAKILGTDVIYFFKDLEEKSSARKSSFAENDSDAFIKQDVFESKETMTLVREFYKIKDPAKRRHIIEIIKAMSGEK